MHIVCMHMAMAVMRSAFNIVLFFYRMSPWVVKAQQPMFSQCGRRLNGVFLRIADDLTGETSYEDRLDFCPAPH